MRRLKKPTFKGQEKEGMECLFLGHQIQWWVRHFGKIYRNNVFQQSNKRCPKISKIKKTLKASDMMIVRCEKESNLQSTKIKTKIKIKDFNKRS